MLIDHATADYNRDVMRVARVIGFIANAFTATELVTITTSLQSTVQSLAVVPSVLGACITALAKCTEAMHCDADISVAVHAAQQWAKAIIAACETKLRQYAMCEVSVSDDATVDVVCRALFVVGELATLGLDDNRPAANVGVAGTGDAASSKGKR